MGGTFQWLELEAPRFGEFARQLYGVNTEAIAKVLHLQQQQGGRLGAVMVEQKLLTSEQVDEILRRQARWVASMRSGDLPTRLSFPISTTVSLCLPCYNEAEVIHEVLDGACTVLPEFLEEFEIVVVDDGSSDGTADAVEEYSKKDSRVRLVRREQNGGYGAAVATGLRAARGEWVCFTDGDGQFNLLDMPQLLVDAHNYDVVIGFRYDRADNVLRRFNANGWKWIVRTLLGVQVKDLDCAFKLFPRRVIDRLELDSQGACISAEIMAQCQRGGVTIAQRPVNHFPRSVGKATGANLKVIAKAFRELPTMWKYRSMKAWRFDKPAPFPAGSHSDWGSEALNDTSCDLPIGDTITDDRIEQPSLRTEAEASS